MDLGQLRYFIKIVENGSFTKAAQQCSVSQPALSQQIAKLERELEQPLFERQGRSIRVTPAGQVLKIHADRILQMVDDAQRQITDDGQTGRISISAIPTIGPYLLPQILNKVGGQFSKASFEINEDVTEVLLKRCANGEIDVGIVALPASTKYVSIEPWIEEELLLALPRDHRLVNRESITVDDIRDAPFVMLQDVHCLVENISGFCHEKRFQPVATARIHQLSTVKNLVAAGHGISLVPKMACSEDPQGPVYRSLAGDKPKRTIAICFNPYRYQSQLLQNFIKGLHELGDPVVMNSDVKFTIASTNGCKATK